MKRNGRGVNRHCQARSIAELGFFGFLRGLPEKEIRADGGAEYRDNSRVDSRDRIGGREPGSDAIRGLQGTDAESAGHVHQQDERQELEIASVTVIGNEDLGRSGNRAQRRQRKRARARQKQGAGPPP